MKYVWVLTSLLKQTIHDTNLVGEGLQKQSKNNAKEETKEGKKGKERKRKKQA